MLTVRAQEAGATPLKALFMEGFTWAKLTLLPDPLGFVIRPDLVSVGPEIPGLPRVA